MNLLKNNLPQQSKLLDTYDRNVGKKNKKCWSIAPCAAVLHVPDSAVATHKHVGHDGDLVDGVPGHCHLGYQGQIIIWLKYNN